MRKGFLIYEEMRMYLAIYEEPVSDIWICNCSILNFSYTVYEENFILFFISVETHQPSTVRRAIMYLESLCSLQT